MLEAPRLFCLENRMGLFGPSKEQILLEGFYKHALEGGKVVEIILRDLGANSNELVRKTDFFACVGKGLGFDFIEDDKIFFGALAYLEKKMVHVSGYVDGGRMKKLFSEDELGKISQASQIEAVCSKWDVITEQPELVFDDCGPYPSQIFYRNIGSVWFNKDEKTSKWTLEVRENGGIVHSYRASAAGNGEKFRNSMVSREVIRFLNQKICEFGGT